MGYMCVMPNQNCTGAGRTARPCGATFTGRGLYKKGGHPSGGNKKSRCVSARPFPVAPMVILYHANMGIFNPISGHLQTLTDTYRRISENLCFTEPHGLPFMALEFMESVKGLAVVFESKLFVLG